MVPNITHWQKYYFYLNIYSMVFSTCSEIFRSLWKHFFFLIYRKVSEKKCNYRKQCLCYLMFVFLCFVSRLFVLFLVCLFVLFKSCFLFFVLCLIYEVVFTHFFKLYRVCTWNFSHKAVSIWLDFWYHTAARQPTI